MRVAIIGSGSFGTAVASMLLQSKHDITIWCHSASVAQAINETGHNSKHMQSCSLVNAYATANFQEALDSVEACILATPSFVVCDVIDKAANYIPEEAPVLLLSKGLCEDGSFLFEHVAQAIGGKERVAVLSGPNHAEELAQGKFAGAVVASTSSKTAHVFQHMISSNHFRLYTSADPVGVSLCGAIKNVVAIACGMTRGLGLGDNASSLLITRGLAETSRLVEACGGDRLTCLGLAGVGDLNATCNSKHSRNGMFGEAFAEQGISVKEYEELHNVVVEGAHAVKSILCLAKQRNIEMPITQTINGLLYNGADIHAAAQQLIDRELKAE